MDVLTILARATPLRRGPLAEAGSAATASALWLALLAAMIALLAGG